MADRAEPPHINVRREAGEPGVRFHLADEVSMISLLSATISCPDVVQKGDYGALLAARYYNQPPASHVFVVVAYRELNESDGFVLTAYLARRLSTRREVMWSR